MKKILGISGSIRPDSYNLALLETAGRLIPADIRFSITHLDGLPLYNDHLASKSPPKTVLNFRDQISINDGVLIACPEYNYSITGVLKNALDWAATNSLGNVLSGKIIAMMGASRTVFGTVRAQLHLRQILLAVNAQVIPKPEVYIRRAQDLVSEENRFHDERTISKIQSLIDALLKEVRNSN